MEDKLIYEAPSAQLVVFPAQDVVTTSGWYELPLEEWDY